MEPIKRRSKLEKTIMSPFFKHCPGKTAEALILEFFGSLVHGFCWDVLPYRNVFGTSTWL